MDSCMERIEAKQRWQAVLDAWGRTTHRLHMREPITLSRCSTIPIILLLIQSLVICIIEACGVALGTAGAVVQLVVTVLMLVWIIMQLELSDAVLERHGGLAMIHSDSVAPEEQCLNEM